MFFYNLKIWYFIYKNFKIEEDSYGTGLKVNIFKFSIIPLGQVTLKERITCEWTQPSNYPFRGN